MNCEPVVLRLMWEGIKTAIGTILCYSISAFKDNEVKEIIVVIL